MFSQNIQAQTAPAPTLLLTAQAWTSASSEQSFRTPRWNKTGCWVSCGCGGSAPAPRKRPGCSFHCQETSWFTHKTHAQARGMGSYTQQSWNKMSQNATLQGNHKVDNKKRFKFKKQNGFDANLCYQLYTLLFYPQQLFFFSQKCFILFSINMTHL